MYNCMCKKIELSRTESSPLLGHRTKKRELFRLLYDIDKNCKNAMEAEVNALRCLQDHLMLGESVLPRPVTAQFLGTGLGRLIDLPVQALDLLQD